MRWAIAEGKNFAGGGDRRGRGNYGAGDGHDELDAFRIIALHKC